LLFLGTISLGISLELISKFSFDGSNGADMYFGLSNNLYYISIFSGKTIEKSLTKSIWP
jgi:hypothetical protein